MARNTISWGYWCQVHTPIFQFRVASYRAELKRSLSLSVKQKAPHSVETETGMVFTGQFYLAMSHTHANASVKSRHNITWEKQSRHPLRDARQFNR